MLELHIENEDSEWKLIVREKTWESAQDDFQEAMEKGGLAFIYDVFGEMHWIQEPKYVKAREIPSV